MTAVVLPCTACGQPAVMRITIRGCEYLRCDPCGNALLLRLPVIEPEHAATVEPIAA